jgi:hypothetical protein
MSLIQILGIMVLTSGYFMGLFYMAVFYGLFPKDIFTKRFVLNLVLMPILGFSLLTIVLISSHRRQTAFIKILTDDYNKKYSVDDATKLMAFYRKIFSEDFKVIDAALKRKQNFSK